MQWHWLLPVLVVVSDSEEVVVLVGSGVMGRSSIRCAFHHGFGQIGVAVALEGVGRTACVGPWSGCLALFLRRSRLSLKAGRPSGFGGGGCLGCLGCLGCCDFGCVKGALANISSLSSTNRIYLSGLGAQRRSDRTSRHRPPQ